MKSVIPFITEHREKTGRRIARNSSGSLEIGISSYRRRIDSNKINNSKIISALTQVTLQKHRYNKRKYIKHDKETVFENNLTEREEESTQTMTLQRYIPKSKSNASSSRNLMRISESARDLRIAEIEEKNRVENISVGTQFITQPQDKSIHSIPLNKKRKFLGRLKNLSLYRNIVNFESTERFDSYFEPAEKPKKLGLYNDYYLKLEREPPAPVVEDDYRFQRAVIKVVMKRMIRNKRVLSYIIEPVFEEKISEVEFDSYTSQIHLIPKSPPKRISSGKRISKGRRVFKGRNILGDPLSSNPAEFLNTAPDTFM